MSHSAFCKLWNIYVADVVPMKPHTNVCVHCDKLREQMKLSHNEEELSEAAKVLARHLETAQDERQYYLDSMDTTREDATTCHLTFVSVQQLELSYHVELFGKLVHCISKCAFVCSCSDSATKQTRRNTIMCFLKAIGADGSKAHGPNTVLSIVDHYLTEHCTGTNKSSDPRRQLCGAK